MWSDVRCFGKKPICDLCRMLRLVRNVHYAVVHYSAEKLARLLPTQIPR